jgi:hypothetical protein
MSSTVLTHSLFDEFGRTIPTGLSAPAHGKIRRYFTCDQPEINYKAIFDRISAQLGAGSLTAADFEKRAKAILDKVQADDATKGITNSIHIPFFLPKNPNIQTRDLGEEVQDVYLKAVEKSFVATLPQYTFTDHNEKEGLKGKLAVLPGSRHERLLNAVAKDDVVGYFFLSLTEYSVPAAIEKTGQLPEEFLLAGGVDTCAAFIGSPNLLLKTEAYPPLVWFNAVTGDRPGAAYHFEAYGYNLTFNRKVHFDQPAEYWASGLVVLG